MRYLVFGSFLASDGSVLAHREVPSNLASEGLGTGEELERAGDLVTLGVAEVQQTTLHEAEEAHEEAVDEPEGEGLVGLVAGGHGGSLVVLKEVGSADGLVTLESALEGLDGRVGVGADEADDLV